MSLELEMKRECCTIEFMRTVDLESQLSMCALVEIEPVTFRDKIVPK
jgi:hypothetical protein